MSERGKYVVFEGVDGTGKSLQAAWMHSKLKRTGIPVAPFLVEEPDGAVRVDSAWEMFPLDKLTDEKREARSLVPAATALRKIVKSKSMGLTPEANQLIFTSARIMNWEQAIWPALESGLTVPTARNYWSTLVYNCIAEGKPTDEVERMTRTFLGEVYTEPDFGVILDIEDEEGRQKRLENRETDSTLDAFESRGPDYQQRIRLGYRTLSAMKNIPLLSFHSQELPEVVHNTIVDLLNEKGIFEQKIKHTSTKIY